ncbi:hypothetical protein KC845_00005 [Candidatus Kaiserbacteria bacterium]|nr:hypothetical protein [Candidatus Kaiserbacteria bacterium]
MNKKILFLLGGLVLIALVAIWVYLLFYGTPESPEEVFTNLGFGNQTDTVILPDTPIIEENLVDVASSPLTQLTLRPVAGFWVGENLLLYTERGTGYIYEINLNTGEELAVTKTTYPRVVEAVFAPNGLSAVYTNQDNYQSVSYLVKFDVDGTNESINLPPSVSDIAYKDDETILYTSPDDFGTIGYEYNFNTLERKELFKFPMFQMHMIWGGGIDNIYAYSAPSPLLEGSAFKITDNRLVPIGKAGNGLVAIANDNLQTFSYINNKRYQNESIFGNKLPTILIPEKCDFVGPNAGSLVCGIPSGNLNSNFLDNWYKGIISTNDTIWGIDLVENSILKFIDLQAVAGRPLDVTDTKVKPNGVFFINKNDHTLWQYNPLLEETSIDENTTDTSSADDLEDYVAEDYVEG